MRLGGHHFLRRGLRAFAYGALGAMVAFIAVYVVYVDSQADLEVWHLAELDEEFTAGANLATFADYLALEDRLFRQLDELVYERVPPEQRYAINRYNRGSLSDPRRWSPNWNRSFELTAPSPKAAVLLLHGMSDSPYSLRHLGERLNAAGAHVLGLRIPGHGTAPSGLVDVSWEDMAAAVQLALRHLEASDGDRPLYVIGYSNGAALAVRHALSALDDETLPHIDRLVLISPAIGVTPVAALAVWQARLGHLLGLQKLAWNAVLPEYDPFKYSSFAVNAGDVVYRLTREIRKGLASSKSDGRLERFPQLLAFASAVDATVSTPALVKGLFETLPRGVHELVLFDINRTARIDPILKSDPGPAIAALQRDPDRTFTLSVVTNAAPDSREEVVRTYSAGNAQAAVTPLGLAWPKDVYSLTHIALPFPPNDALYGGVDPEQSPGVSLGDIALRGERGVLRISASDMLRQRWNPFYPYLEERVIEFLGLGDAT